MLLLHAHRFRSPPREFPRWRIGLRPLTVISPSCDLPKTSSLMPTTFLLPPPSERQPLRGPAFGLPCRGRGIFPMLGRKPSDFSNPWNVEAEIFQTLERFLPSPGNFGCVFSRVRKTERGNFQPSDGNVPALGTPAAGGRGCPKGGGGWPLTTHRLTGTTESFRFRMFHILGFPPEGPPFRRVAGAPRPLFPIDLINAMKRSETIWPSG